VQILVSNGIVGFALIFFAFIYILREIFKCKKKLSSKNIFDKYELSKGIMLSAILINLWPLIPSGNFFNNWVSMIYFYPIGFYFYFKHLDETKIN
jgi:O-antigen ligase